MAKRYELSDHIKIVLKDGDELRPATVAGEFRLITGREGHNVLGEGEHPVSESEMIDGVMNRGLPSRWRSETNPDRKTANHFSISSPSVASVHVKVGSVWVQMK